LKDLQAKIWRGRLKVRIKKQYDMGAKGILKIRSQFYFRKGYLIKTLLIQLKGPAVQFNLIESNFPMGLQV